MIGSIAGGVGTACRWLLYSRHGAAAIAHTIASRVMLAAMNLATGVITARSLNVEGRGEQSAIGLWPFLLPYLLSLGMSTAVRFCIRRMPERRVELFTVAIVITTLTSVLAFFAGLVLIPLWLHQYSSSVIREAEILMLFSPQVSLGLTLTAMFETQGEFKLANSIRLTSSVLTLVALLLMALNHVLTPFLASLSYIAPPILTTAWMAWKLRSFFARRFFDFRADLKFLGSYGLRAYGIDVLTTLSQQIDQVLVVGILSASAMGIYTVALSSSRVLQLLHSSVVTVVFPNASELDRERAVAMVARSARINTLIATACTVALAASLPILIPLLYGRQFAGAIPITRVLIVEALLGGLTYVLSQAFMACNRPGLVTAFQGLGLGIAVPSMLILMPRFGLMGAAISLLISTCTRLVFVLASFPLVLHVPMPKLVPTLDDLVSFRRALAARI